MSLLSVHLDCDRWGRPRHPLTIITKGRRKNELTEFGIEVHFVDTKSQIGQVLYHGRDGHATKLSWHGRLARE